MYSVLSTFQNAQQTEDNIVTTQCFPNLSGKGFWRGVFTDKGKSIILSGRTVKIFNCDEERFVQTLSKFGNALVAVSHSHETICVVNASSKDVIILVEYVRNNEIFTEINRTSIKGINTDGGKPCFSCDDNKFFFCTEGRQIWCYTRDDRKCICIYQVEHPDQWLSFDMYKDQLLVTLNSASLTDHTGFDVLTLDGTCLKSLRFRDGQTFLKSVNGKWLDADNFVIIYPMSVKYTYDIFQSISWRLFDSIPHYSSHSIIERPGKAFYDVLISPNRNFITWIWMDLLHGGRYVIEVHKLDTMEKINEYTVSLYMNTCFSDDDRYLFLCSEEFMRFDLATHFPKHS